MLKESQDTNTITTVENHTAADLSKILQILQHSIFQLSTVRIFYTKRFLRNFSMKCVIIR